MNTAKHTPTPWELFEDNRPGMSEIFHFDDWKKAVCSFNGGKIVARINGIVGITEPEANANFIVRAANAFYPLMEEHKDGECYCLNPEENLGRNPCAWCKVEAALAKSEEKK